MGHCVSCGKSLPPLLCTVAGQLNFTGAHTCLDIGETVQYPQPQAKPPSGYEHTNAIAMLTVCVPLLATRPAPCVIINVS